MPRSFPLVVILAVVLFALMWGGGSFTAPYSGGGWGMRASNLLAGPGAWSGYGPGMMHGYYRSGGEWGWGRNLNLTTDNVKNYLERWLAWQGNPRLKLGDVKEKDADTIVADIVTKDNSLVQRLLVNRRNGFTQPSED